MEKFKNGTKKFNIADVDGMDIYTISEKDGKKYICMKGCFILMMKALILHLSLSKKCQWRNL